jgi:crotonobetainyl-CoA:carnitine CoA-transferase CaiB-like acyl-CoA transferase
MGASVLKIEPPGGDELQTLGPRDRNGRPIFYNAINAGKATVTMDLKRAEVVAAFFDLIKSTDILIESFRPGAMTRLGLDYETLRKHNPSLIYCSLSGFGATGPLAQVAGHDGNYLGLSGILHRNGSDGPFVFEPPIADTTGSLFAVISILGALNARRRDGKGCKIDLALADVVMPLQLFQIAAFGANGTIPQREGTYLSGGAAYYRVYRTADERHVMLGAVEPKFWRNFCVAADRPEWIGRQMDAIPQRTLIREVADFLGGMSSKQSLDIFEPADCCFSLVLDLAEAIESPHHKMRGLVRYVEHNTLQALFPALIDDEHPIGRSPLRAAEVEDSYGSSELDGKMAGR